MSNESNVVKGAAQEAVAWQRRYKNHNEWFNISKVIYEATKSSSFADRYDVRELYAAPVPAALMFDYQDVLGSAAAAEAIRDAGELLRTPAAPGIDLATAWAEGYESGVMDERISEANIGIAGFGAKVAPARANPYLIDASPKGATFPNDGNSEAQFIADGERLNCPACGGSGHVEDSPKGGSDAEVALYQVRPRSFPPERGWRSVDKRSFFDYSERDGYPDAEWERRKLCVIQATSA